MRGEYTVYKHTSPNNKVYIGITRQNPPEKRWGYNGNGYNDTMYFSKAIKKYGWDNFQHEILFEGLTKEEAEQKEIELITFYKSNQRDFGYNIANGGNCIGTVSEETKKRISESKIGEKHPKYGKHLSEEEKLILSKKLKGRKRSKESIEKMIKTKNSREYNWKPLSEERKRKISEHSSVPISQYSKDGVLIKNHDSALSAGNEVGISPPSITACCKGKQKTAGGFIWRYSYEKLTEEHLDWCNSRKIAERQGKPIVQYSLSGEFIQEFNDVKDIVKTFGYSKNVISSCCRGSAKTAYGFIWRYSEDELTDEYIKWCNDKNITKPYSKRAVVQYSMDGQFIRRYDSITIASLETGIYANNISLCCKSIDKIRTAGGFIWKYADIENDTNEAC